MAIDNIKREFASPDNRFRFAPFWFLNHDLSEEETRWQVREMNEHGVGGFILHARHGLITPYMGEQWMENLAAAIDEGKKLSMKAYLYDENNWPSGSADGQVFQDNPEYLMSVCYLSEQFDVSGGKVERDIDIGDQLIAIIAVPLADDHPTGFPEQCRNIADYLTDNHLNWEADGDWRVFVFARRWHPQEGFFGGYVDTLNPAAIARFIELTHKPYAERFSEQFGATVDGIFTDEPHMFPPYEAMSPPYDAVTWTGKLPAEFEMRAGYPLLPVLPALFENVGPQTAKFRCDYRQTVTDLFANSYVKQIYDFCEPLNLNSIGHLVLEEELLMGIKCFGDYFQAAQWLHWGGCDYLGSRTWPEPGTPTQPHPYNNIGAVKLASSAAHLLDKPVTMNECFGVGRQWAIDLRTLKWMGDFVIALGTNLLEPHAFYYSIQGFRKWECPPSEFYQSPFWPYYRTLSDYIGRLSVLFRGGQHIADVAFLYPVKSVWAEMDITNNSATTQLKDSFDKLTRLLPKLNYDFDFVSEEMLQEADFADGKIEIKTLEGKVAEQFKLLVIPALTTISRATAAALQRYVDVGGRIVALGQLPSKSCERGEDDYISQLFTTIFGDDYELSFAVADADQPVTSTHDISTGPDGILAGAPLWIDDEAMLKLLGEVLDTLVEPDLLITDDDGKRISDIVHYHYRHEDTHFLLLQNTNQQHSYDCTVSLEITGDVNIWDAETGETRPAPVVHAMQDGLDIPVSLPPVGATVLAIDTSALCPSTPLIEADLPILEVDNEQAVGLASETGSYSVTIGSLGDEPRVITAPVRAMPTTVELDENWQFTTDKPNALPLTQWDYEIDNALPLPEFSHSWLQREDAVNPHRIFTATFEAEVIPQQSQMLLDGPKTDKIWRNSQVRAHNVFVNGQLVSNFARGQYLDHYIYETDLTGFLRQGKNEVKMISWMHACEPSSIDHPVIITGRFAVAGRKRLRMIAEPERIQTGGWENQGYPYYSGIATYCQKFRLTAAQRRARLYLEMERPGDLAEVIINDVSCGVRAWEPFTWDISEVVTTGPNELKIKVANSLQNLLAQEPKASGLLGSVRIVPYKQIHFKLA